MTLFIFPLITHIKEHIRKKNGHQTQQHTQFRMCINVF